MPKLGDIVAPKSAPHVLWRVHSFVTIVPGVTDVTLQLVANPERGIKRLAETLHESFVLVPSTDTGAPR